MRHPTPHSLFYFPCDPCYNRSHTYRSNKSQTRLMSRPTLSRRAVARDFSLAYQWARTYTRSDLRADLAAGLTGATAGAPQAMAFAIVAGISPAYGPYTAIARR